MELTTIYILIYKIKSYPDNWIIKYSNSSKKLKKIIGYQTLKEKKIGNYYIVKTIDSESLLYDNFQQFKTYSFKDDDYILYCI